MIEGSFRKGQRPTGCDGVDTHLSTPSFNFLPVKNIVVALQICAMLVDYRPVILKAVGIPRIAVRHRYSGYPQPFVGPRFLDGLGRVLRCGLIILF